jgi:hypothetical protein
MWPLAPALIGSERVVSAHSPERLRCTRCSALLSWQPSWGSIAEGREAFKLRVLPPLRCPIVVLLDQQTNDWMIKLA